MSAECDVCGTDLVHTDDWPKMECPRCVVQMKLSDALDLLEWVELNAPYGLPKDSFAERLRACLVANGRPVRFWDEVASVPNATTEGGS